MDNLCEVLTQYTGFGENYRFESYWIGRTNKNWWYVKGYDDYLKWSSFLDSTINVISQDGEYSKHTDTYTHDYEQWW